MAICHVLEETEQPSVFIMSALVIEMGRKSSPTLTLKFPQVGESPSWDLKAAAVAPCSTFYLALDTQRQGTFAWMVLIYVLGI